MVLAYSVYTMEGKNLSLKPLEDAIATLNEALHDVERCPAMLTLRDGAIKRFEYTYELAVSTIRRVVEWISGSQGKVPRSSFARIVREAQDYSLIGGDMDRWDNFRKCRNMSCHLYAAAMADGVFAAIPDFAKEVEIFLARAKERLADG
jgi:nucleotidyltransferase substrate binding protein (TIGR01987 family)